ncbi:MAG: hypothetical protein IJ489_06850 [Clostridia bacterium]|nr:hypothetical protein [Clostridia bacterium]
MNLKFWKRSDTVSEPFSDVDMRERIIAENIKTARTARSSMDAYWQRMRAYYDGTHDTARQTDEFLSSLELPWRPCTVPDGFLHVEGQIEATPPDFEFSARTGHESDMARQREAIVRYVVQNGDMTAKNAVNERRLNLYGSAVWKLAVTCDAQGEAQIAIENPPIETVFPDPFGKTVDDCEYIACVYRMNTGKAVRIFTDDLQARGLTMEGIMAGKHRGKRDLLGLGDTVEITEYWFRQADSGEIALSILIEGNEVRYLPKFWSKTSYDSYPFVIYARIPTENMIWGKSELEPIIPLIDAADRQLLFAQLNTAFFANDILVYEENAFAGDSYPENRPGAVWKLRPGMMDKVKRLGGLSSDNIAHYEIAEKYRFMMKETLGNYDFMQGDSSTQVTTATGLALLGDYASKRTKAKNICKKAGFERLYRLIDAMVLEIFSAERLHAITDCEGAFCFEDYQKTFGFVPMVDVSIHVGEGFENSRSFTLSALSELCTMDMNEMNYPIVRAYISALGIPERTVLTEALDKKFENGEMTHE